MYTQVEAVWIIDKKKKKFF